MGPGATALTRMPLLGVIICARPLVNCRMAPCSIAAWQPDQETLCRYKDNTATLLCACSHAIFVHSKVQLRSWTAGCVSTAPQRAHLGGCIVEDLWGPLEPCAA